MVLSPPDSPRGEEILYLLLSLFLDFILYYDLLKTMHIHY